MGTKDNGRDWLFSEKEIQNSASRREGCSLEEENVLRAKSIWFLFELAKILDAKIIAAATASVYFHRYFLSHSFKSHNRFYVASVCLFLASKNEDQFKTIERVIVACNFLRERGKDGMNEDIKVLQHEYNKVYHTTYHYMDEKKEKKIFNDKINTLKQEFITIEKSLLISLRFDMHVTHPHVACSNHLQKIKVYIPDAVDSTKVKQEVYSTINDSFRSTLCLRYSSQEIAVAVVYLSTLRLSITPSPQAGTSSSKWYDILKPDMSEESLHGVCLEIVKMYRRHAMQWSNRGLALSDELSRVERLLTHGRTPASTSEISPYLALPHADEDYPYGRPDATVESRQVLVTKVLREGVTASQAVVMSPLSSSVESTPLPPPPPDTPDLSESMSPSPSESPMPPPPSESPHSWARSIGDEGPTRRQFRSDSLCSEDSVVPPPPSDRARPSAPLYDASRYQQLSSPCSGNGDVGVPSHSRPRSDSSSSMDSFVPPPPPKRARV